MPGRAARRAAPAVPLVVAVLGAALVSVLAAVPAVAVPPAPPPAVDDQAVVVEVPGTPSGSTSPCPVLGREDFVYTFADDRLPAGTQAVDPWTEPVRLGLARPPVTATVSLRADVTLPEGAICRYAFTMASFAGGDSAGDGTGGRALVGGPVTGVVERDAPTLTLRVAAPPCAGQVDLWAGEDRYDDGVVPADRSVATWSGDRGCTGGGVVADLVAFGVPACPGAPLTWLIVNANGRAVEVALVLEGGAAPVSSTVVAEPGVTPVQLAGVAAGAAALAASWRDDTGAERNLREPAAPAPTPGTPQFEARCSGTGPGLDLDKTAEPVEGEAVAPGSAVTWTVTVRNTSAVALPDVEVVDVVPAYATVADAGGGEADPDGRLLRWTVSLAPGEAAALQWTGDVATAVPGGADLVNTALAPVYGVHDTTRHPLAAPPPTSPAATPSTDSTGTAPTTAAAGPPGPRGPLARTGAGLVAVLLTALVAVLLGTALVRAARRGPVTARRGARVL
jgi:uncharacterized repeat protein (TIGR01451 family)